MKINTALYYIYIYGDIYVVCDCLCTDYDHINSNIILMSIYLNIMHNTLF